MITKGQLREICREWIYKLITMNGTTNVGGNSIDLTFITMNDVRYVKGNDGAFPLKIVKSKDETKLVPYLPESDVFVLFDLVDNGIKDVETIQDENGKEKITSRWDLTLFIYIYGRNGDTVKQYLLASLTNTDIYEWINGFNMSLVAIPDVITPMDSFENGQWWIRNNLELNFNIAQEISYNGVVEIENITLNDVENKVEVL